MGYKSKYMKEHYKKIWIRKDVYEALREICISGADMSVKTGADIGLSECLKNIISGAYIGNAKPGADMDKPISGADIAESVLRYAKTLASEAKAIHYPGGDWYIKDEIIKILRYAPCSKCTLVEVFGGSGVISQFAPRSKFTNIIYNDKDELLVNLIRVIKENGKDLQKILVMLPYSREIYEYISDIYSKTEFKDIQDPLIRAVYTYYLINSSINGQIGAGFSYSRTVKDNFARKYTSHVISIEDVAKRFRDVVIECRDFTDIIKIYDSENTVFYLDPPYIEREDFYRIPFTSLQARQLVNLLNSIKGYYLLKIHEDQERYYTGLKYVSRIPLEHVKRMTVSVGEEREKFTYIFLTNYQIGKILTQ